ncbi:conserved hypothetical protein [Caldicellulosiruptor hydrothermalis 108]|uniref:Uncharacterized protein n=1 Tax=Caldicellulosiruptor hydrothermalis (strain DSM 18901 / VKM B-2411 / 108) TaxID=632292 RepID=E4Q8V8_CALH1|nr:hypothetical protein [Caldicellulosiruptor hydrothermalis]ADQ06877.1 conserved hypothetical protein [Caldicellulosiruptor hydrothermalis 108]
MANVFLFFMGFVGGVVSLLLYLKFHFPKLSKKSSIKLVPTARSFDELREMFSATKEDVENELNSYLEFSTIEKGKKLAEKIFCHVTVCLGILASLERFGVNPNEVLEKLKNENIVREECKR